MDRSKLKILVADDEGIIRKLLRAGLENQGHVVETATDGADGLQQLKNQVFDVVITDVSMPRINGLDMLRAAAQQKLIQHDTLVIIIGGGYTDDEQQNMPATVSNFGLTSVYFLPKPFEMKKLIEMISAKETTKNGQDTSC